MEPLGIVLRVNGWALEPHVVRLLVDTSLQCGGSFWEELGHFEHDPERVVLLIG